MHRYIPIALSGMILAAVACTVPLGGPPIPPESAAPSAEALASFHDKWLDLPKTLSDGSFTLTFSEEEVASTIDAALNNSGSGAEASIPLQDTHVNLNGDIVLYAQTEGQLFNASGMLTLHPTVGSEGQLEIQVISSEFGRASFDDPILERIAAEVEHAISSPIEGLPVSIVLTGASVVDGELVLTGNIVE